MSVCNRNHVRCIILRRCRRGGEADQQTPASLNQAKDILKERDEHARGNLNSLPHGLHAFLASCLPLAFLPASRCSEARKFI